MIRVERHEEVRPGIWRYTVPGFGIEGRGRVLQAGGGRSRSAEGSGGFTQTEFVRERDRSLFHARLISWTYGFLSTNIFAQRDFIQESDFKAAPAAALVRTTLRRHGEAYLGHKSIQHTVRYTELSPNRLKNFWR